MVDGRQKISFQFAMLKALNWPSILRYKALLVSVYTQLISRKTRVFKQTLHAGRGKILGGGA
ncbi:MAG TPA: hypothetical protein DD706_14470, partial [Nitrospiraceae bacterium]|nr:hypothetical protein [Nitrospiraceae bacterium]